LIEKIVKHYLGCCNFYDPFKNINETNTLLKRQTGLKKDKNI